MPPGGSNWAELTARLVSVYKESENVDFVRSLKARSEALKEARHVDDE